MDLPSTAGKFFGRESETEAIAGYLDDPQRRLITLFGPGGIGKTRLAIEAARVYGESRGSRVIFIDLQSAEQPSHVENALIQTLRINATERGSALSHVTEYLADSESLLILDNFEQVLDAAPMIGSLVEATPGLKVIVTSRSPLRLSQEWLMPVDGLPVPQPVRLRDSTTNPAIRLFIDRVRKLMPDAEMEQEIPAIERICRLSGGMPLALEIAASWSHALGLSEIADEMANDTRFLRSGLRDAPERHRSIRAVLERSMELLSEEERAVLFRLSVFRGSLTRAAAIQVAGADNAMLASLVERSLVKHDADGCYRLHELIRQFAAEEFARSPADFESTLDAHSRYYMSFLAERWEPISQGLERETAAEVEREYENIRAAWSFAVEKRRASEVCDGAETLSMFFQFRARYLEAGELFADAVAAFKTDLQPEEREALAQLLAEHAWFGLRLGKIDDAESAFRESKEIRQRYGIPVRGFAVDPELGLAYVLATRGELARAKELATGALRRVDIGEIRQSHALIAGYLLAHLASREGDLDGARSYARAALEVVRRMNGRWFTAFCHQVLGEVEGLSGDTRLAKREFEAALEINLEFGDRAGEALSHVYLGELDLLHGQAAEAYTHLEQSRDAYLQSGDRGGVARAEAGLGIAAAEIGDRRTAAQWLRSALETAKSIELDAVMLDALASVGSLGLSEGIEEESLAVLAFVSGQESTESRTRARIEALHVDPGATPLGKDEAEAIALANSVLDRISEAPVPGKVSEAASNRSSGAVSGLAEPLTEREVEILGFIAEGLSNQQIAERLVVSLSTVKWHNYQMFAKLGVKNRTGAVAAARLEGAIAADERR